MGFSDQLKKARHKTGYTQQQIADLMGITKSTYCGYETGKRQPDVAKIKQLANILNTSGDILLETGFAKEHKIKSNQSDNKIKAISESKSDILESEENETFSLQKNSLIEKQVLESINTLTNEQLNAVLAFIKYLIENQEN